MEARKEKSEKTMNPNPEEPRVSALWNPRKCLSQASFFSLKKKSFSVLLKKERDRVDSNLETLRGGFEGVFFINIYNGCM